MINIKKSRRGSKWNQLESAYVNDMKSEFEELGESGTFTANDIDELKAIREAVREKHRKLNTKQDMAKSKAPIEDAVIEEAAPFEADKKPEMTFDFGEFNNFTGLGEIPNEREYNKIGSTEFENQYIAPPKTQSATESILEQIHKDEVGGEEGAEQSQGGDDAISGGSFLDDLKNPEMNPLSDKEKRLAAEQLVDTVLGGYEALHPMAAHYAKMDIVKLNKLVIEQEVDLSIRLPIDSEGTEVNLIEYAEGYNEGTDEIFAYDPTFNARVREPLVRIFMKKDWGITDEQFVALEFAKDLGKKVAMFAQMKSTSNMIINAFKDITRQNAAMMQRSVSPDIITRPSKVEIDD